MKTIEIEPVSIWTSSGVKEGNAFEVRYVNYNNGPAVADCHIWSIDPDTQAAVEISSQLVPATAEQTADWTSDEAFYAVLAQNAGLVPVTPVAISGN